MSTVVSPIGAMNVLSSSEVSKLQDTSQGGLYKLFRQCALAALNCDEHSDNPYKILEQHKDFDIRIIQEHRGLKLELINAPSDAFVDGKLIKGIRQNLFSVVRDILYVANEVSTDKQFDTNKSDDISNMVFHMLRHAKAFVPKILPNLVVCWGGHSISDYEYKYTKRVGYQLGLRGYHICTGCGPGAMKGPMKGATIGHAKQRTSGSRFIGLTEPGIIAAESPNPIVNELIIMPDIEKRLEAFVRLGHGIVVFPGGPGTCEEILYILGILLHPKNQHIPFPLIFTGPVKAKEYFQQIDKFIGKTLGTEAQRRYKIIIENPPAVAKEMKQGLEEVSKFRKKTGDAYHFNWLLTIDHEFQLPFEPTHEEMAALKLTKDQPTYLLAANLRRAMSGIVAGNVKEVGIQAIEQHGPFKLTGDPELMADIDQLLQSFVDQHRMKLPGSHYEPCYKIMKN
ncbi:nucleotide 5'-monophosphate nucleosidase PpnN [Spartinivicinus sp. A2-2]|uniref:AMP nucleosidase n=1 Tax=Spartinivicinus poritis TaxID=2994640 RepID=A0ABT5U995_9GAMM|nr:nucleotide 5'-monophosphate nucleosidase PpnN [Spartinivicinus sp. A2-2]